MYNYMAWYVMNGEDLVGSIKFNMANFNFSKEVALKCKRELESKRNKDKDYKYAYCFASLKCQDIDDYVDLYTVRVMLSELCDIGYIPAYNLMGNMYYYGQGGSRSNSEALRHYEYAHNNGFKVATYNLALHYIKLEQYDKARYYIEDCIKGGYTPGYYLKGYGYHFGKYGYPQDKIQAVNFYETAAKAGYPKAQYYAGVMYMSGIGCTVDHQKALKYLESAAMFDDAEAKYLVGRYYFFGEHVAKYPERALAYFEQAADMGHIPSMAFTGLCYLEGVGCFKDRVKAEKYIKDAAYNGDELGNKLLSKLYR